MTTYSQVTYTYTDGGSNTFTIPFSYISEDYLYVYINSILTTDYTLDISQSQITINTGLSEGDTVLIRRITPIDEALVKFSDIGLIKKTNLNTLYEHLLNGLQEITDSNEINTTDIETISASLSALYEAVTALVSQADNLDLDVDSLQTSLTNLQTLCANAVSAAAAAQTSADTAQQAADSANEALESCANVDLSNLSDEGKSLLQQYTGTGSGTGSISLTVWEDA